MSQRELTFTDNGELLRDGLPHRILSGAMHYFRVHPDLWEDRVRRVAAMGCNTVETYVAWNFHQPVAGRDPSFEGWCDLARFVDLAGRLGLDVIVRPGPYICAEWEFGGLPAWLLAEPSMPLRCHDPAYEAVVDEWFGHLCEVLRPGLATNGGPVVAVQVENEYGSYGNDTEHLAFLRDCLQAKGIDVPLFTSDGPTDLMLSGGTIPGVWATVNFGSGAGEAFSLLRDHRPHDHPMCMEFWCGWFDHWGEPHHTRPTDQAAAALAEVLAEGASVNVFVAHGGTSFGPYAGANHGPGPRDYQPTVGSYDYDAPIGEAGELTETFEAFRALLAPIVEAGDGVVPEPPPTPPRQQPQDIPLASCPTASLYTVLPTLPSSVSAAPRTMEQLGQSYGLTRYATTVRAGAALSEPLRLHGLADRAQVYVDGALVGAIDRREESQELPVELSAGDHLLEILVEATGRVNYGPRLADRKGLRGVRLGYQHLFGWRHTSVELATVPALAEGGATPDAVTLPPFLVRARVQAPAHDGFLSLPGSTSRCRVWINGFDLGVLLPEGPQRTLYAPGPLWRDGDNDVLVLAMDSVPDRLHVGDLPDLGPTA